MDEANIQQKGCSQSSRYQKNMSRWCRPMRCDAMQCNAGKERRRQQFKIRPSSAGALIFNLGSFQFDADRITHEDGCDATEGAPATTSAPSLGSLSRQPCAETVCNSPHPQYAPLPSMPNQVVRVLHWCSKYARRRRRIKQAVAARFTPTSVPNTQLLKTGGAIATNNNAESPQTRARLSTSEALGTWNSTPLFSSKTEQENDS
ncbi:hypothetical protein LX32DRAFT_654403 [Colletotrichum zoysiae]|uniref:Uncharacterized protein n=1 Tax=Colletotrichum zoysiae TaxID=1216348 RepID=A0AAD9M2X9_9PEZI|nr:hypothetical protein LX32DRAFT_654403 [Colletotrichum zoysiae]